MTQRGENPGKGASEIYDIPFEGLARATHPDRLFLIHSHPQDGFYTGIGTRDLQVLAGVDGRRLVIGLFSPSGELNSVERRTLPRGKEVEAYLVEEFGATPGPVRVKRFRIPPDEEQASDPIQAALIGESGLAISPLPLHLSEFLADPTSYEAEDRKSLSHSIRFMVEREDFALYWGNEYFFDRDGQVYAS